MDRQQTKVILVGVGGATCSGKTTLAKHLHSILPDSCIIHQDNALIQPQELIPYHPVHSVQDWDAPQGAIDWPRFRNFLKTVKQDGEIPPDHKSHDHLNEQKDIPIDEGIKEKLERQFLDLQAAYDKKGVYIKWRLVDGFLLYWDKEVIDQLDIRIFLRVPHDVLKERREERHGYHTAEGSLWQDPPGYWENIVYPAYLEAHQEMFEGGDLENGKPTNEKVERLFLMEPVKESLTMTKMVEKCCAELLERGGPSI
ncbi:hypothetical protein HYDPIDRAFT_84316 [Hydnomerulius pinastri MD-312]|nr:hypothetical protein HYDPIDRAFT_84316 [Hydnomerulius pinastri MD-312]